MELKKRMQNTNFKYKVWYYQQSQYVGWREVLVRDFCFLHEEITAQSEP